LLIFSPRSAELRHFRNTDFWVFVVYTHGDDYLNMRRTHEPDTNVGYFKILNNAQYEMCRSLTHISARRTRRAERACRSDTGQTHSYSVYTVSILVQIRTIKWNFDETEKRAFSSLCRRNSAVTVAPVPETRWEKARPRTTYVKTQLRKCTVSYKHVIGKCVHYTSWPYRESRRRRLRNVLARRVCGRVIATVRHKSATTTLSPDSVINECRERVYLRVEITSVLESEFAQSLRKSCRNMFFFTRRI